MNDRYLFRGKRTDNGEWVYGNYCYVELLDKSGYADLIIQQPIDGETRRVIPETVGQYTGLTDKNGKRIFEGDIVKADEYIFFVEFGKCGGVANDENYGYMGYYLDGFDSMTKNVLRLGLRNDICYFTDIEVIGNIHDNSEFVEVER